jgi:hypothetical protein
MRILSLRDVRGTTGADSEFDMPGRLKQEDR